ncbi:MAG TPA: winged helix-turn-helix domain-containing protein [Candidatus Acidoferrum sp.]|nr:winged helix-turn-helix domain-containing protein [Candidatus Acidoferrum sp.]
MNPPKVKFGDFELDVAGYALSRIGHAIKLERIPMELLLLLVDRRGQLVMRDEILEKLWGKDAYLDVDNSINTAISKIRLVLKDDPEDPAFIKTVPGKGYRFIGSITVLPDGKDAFTAPLDAVRGATHMARADGPALLSESRAPSKPRRRWLWPSIAGVFFIALLAGWNWRGSLRRIVLPGNSPVIRSLAVLPLENLTGDASQEYFADGMTDALITDLAQIGALRVISRTSIMRYKGTRKALPDIARELGVDGIVEGTVTRSGNRIRITSQLIYAPSDQHLWAHGYERDLGDVVTLEGEVAQAIASEVRAALTPEQHTRLSARAAANSGAYEAYLKGRYYWNQRTPRGVQKSIEFFRQATEKDPNFAVAYAGLADAYSFSSILGVLAPKESYPEAKAAATKALVLDPELAEAHAALGVVKSHYDFDFPGAQREFLKAIELSPNYANAHLFYSGAYLTPMGRHEEAIAEMKKALELDPLSLPLNNYMGNAYLWAGDYEESFRQFRRTIDMDPTFPLAHFFLAGLLEDTGKFEEAIAEIQKGKLLLGASPDETDALAAEVRKALQTAGSKGYWQKNLELTLKFHKKAGPEYHPAIEMAGAYARAGDRENAFRWLEKSFADREGQDITILRWLPDFKSLHGDRRFADLLTRMGLPH